MTHNLHIEHPEDSILTGDSSVLDWLCEVSDISVKMDGSVAIVWGTNPENGKFFVGKKSVFNKVKVQICYTHADIENFYSEKEELAEILHTCLDFLPRTENVYQGDWLGYGQSYLFTPNTLTYDFGSCFNAHAIICPHTVYSGASIRTMIASPLSEVLDSTDDVVFVQPTVDCTTKAVAMDEVCAIYNKAKFLTEKDAKQVKVIINAFIREGKAISHDMLTIILGDEMLANLYLCVIAQKGILMSGMKVYDGPKVFLNGEPADHEGYVRSNKYGCFKLVDRYTFSAANFNSGRFQGQSAE